MENEKKDMVRAYNYEEILTEMFDRLTCREQYGSFRKLVVSHCKGNLQQEIFEWLLEHDYLDENNPAEKSFASSLADKMADDIVDRVEAGRLVISKHDEWLVPVGG